MESALEYILTHAYKAEMVSFMYAHPECFEEAVQLAISDKQPYSWRSAWLLWSVMEDNDQRIQEHIREIIDSIATKKEGHQRELIKILLLMELNEEEEGYLFNVCVTLWEQINKAPSLRYTAFRGIFKMAQKYPDLTNDMKFLMQDQYWETLSPGVKRSLSKMIGESAQ